MAKPYEAPNKNQDRADEVRKQDDARKQENARKDEEAQRQEDRDRGRRPEEDDVVLKEQQRQADEANKARNEYLDGLNKHLEEIVTNAGREKERNPSYLNLAVGALRNAAMQIEAQTPQGAENTKAHHNL